MNFVDIVKKDIEILQGKYNHPFDGFEYYTILYQSFTYDLITENLFKNKGDKDLIEKIELFKSQFLKLNEEKLKNTNLLWIRGELHHWFTIESLLKKLYHYLLSEYINGVKDLNLLLEKAKQSFHLFLDRKQLPIEIWVKLDGLSIKENVKIDNEIELVHLDYIITIYRDGHSFNPTKYPYLIYKTEIKIGIEKDRSNYGPLFSLFSEDWEHQWYNLNLVLFSFYLSGLAFSYSNWTIKQSWWATYESFDLKSPIEEWELIKPIAEELFELNSELNSKNKNITKIRKLIIESNIMNNSKSQLLINRYFQMFDRKSTQDRILDEFIILESIYTGSNKSEIRFRLSLNIASFIGENKEDFNEINQFIKDIYSIRSAIVHGDQWKNKLKKEKIKKYFNFKEDSNYTSNAAKAIFLRLKNIIDNTILGIMKWEIENEESFFDKAKGLFFIEHKPN